MKKKTFHAPIVLKADGIEGQFTAEFATLEVIDHDNDVTRPGAFQDGQETLIEPWNHNYGMLPVGKGVIHEKENKAVIEGQFFLDTQSGLEHYRVVKALGPLQEWSYTFEIEKASQGQFEAQDVQFLEKLDVWGVAPVTRGAGIDTRTTDIKGAKPYPNEHSCRLKSPGDFVRFIRKHVTDNNDVDGYTATGLPYDLIIGFREDGSSDVQAHRYPKEKWTEKQARAHCKAHDGKTFEPASESASIDHAVIRVRIDLIELED